MNDWKTSKCALLAFTTIASVALGQTNALDESLIDRITNREYPSVFQAWNQADVDRSFDKWATAARHDLLFNMPLYFGLEWNNHYLGLATTLKMPSVGRAKRNRGMLMDINPKMILLAELRYYEAPPDYLPRDHRWWLSDEEGSVRKGWEEGGSLRLNLADGSLRDHLAERAAAIVRSGAVDGVMLDLWRDQDPLRLDLIRRIRAAVGDKALILVNTNDRLSPNTVEYVNGHYLECARSKSSEDWKRITDALIWAEKNVRQPPINCLETWYATSRADVARMRATTTLSLTHSNGYCLFGDPNPLPTPDHLHDWYSFWDEPLGKPTGEMRHHDSGAAVREFENGFAVYNPPDNGRVSIHFDEALTSATTDLTSQDHEIAALDGDILLRRR